VKIKKILFVFLVALIMRIVYAWFFVDASNLILEDQMMYIQLAQQYPSTGFLGVTSDRVPGYPLLVATIYNLFGENNMAVVMVQIFIDSLTCVIIGLIAESVIPRGFLVAGLISALNLNMIILSGMILTDTLFLFLFSIFILLFYHYIKSPNYFKLFMAISMLCLSTLVRPVSYYMVFMLLPFIFWFAIQSKWTFRQMLSSFLMYLIPIVIILGPIQYRNYHEYDSLSLVSQGGSHILYWVVPAVYQYSGQGSYQDGSKLARSSLKKAIHRDGFNKNLENSFKESSYKMKVAKEVILDIGLFNALYSWSVGSMINLLLPSVANAPVVRNIERPSFYESTGNGFIEKIVNYITNTDSLKYLSIISIGFLISLLFFITSIFGFYRMMKFVRYKSKERDVDLFLFLFFIVVYFLAITGPVIGAKYRLPFESVLTVYFSYAFTMLIKNGSR